jgi:2-polyprenyl-6-methoxyphenol hydroxylase-like FAD-dependent oxidoreductase
MTQDAHAVVAGAGPVGLFAALKLAQAGISVTVLEAQGRYRPRASCGGLPVAGRTAP